MVPGGTAGVTSEGTPQPYIRWSQPDSFVTIGP
jgi:hypothetical protein